MADNGSDETSIKPTTADGHGDLLGGFCEWTGLSLTSKKLSPGPGAVATERNVHAVRSV